MAHHPPLNVGSWRARARHSLFAATLGALALSCSEHLMPAAAPPQPLHAPWPHVALYVGTGESDVTPPAGVATFGHGPEARIARGFWTRLQCHAFVFLAEDEPTPMALVPCDLAAVSTLLQRRVVQHLQAKGVPMVPQRLFLSATHTHAGPAHYFDAESYGGAASSQGPGFDPAMVDFLAERISNSIELGYARAQEDRRRHRPTELRWLHGEALGLTHNRSLASFRLNDPRTAPPTPTSPPGEVLDPASLAVDPNLDLLQLRRSMGDGSVETIGWLGLFAMHPTVLSATSRYLGADVFGVTTRLLQAELRRRHGDQGGRGGLPVVGLINTNEGDLSPRWSTGDRGEAIAFGTRLAQRLLELDRTQAAEPFEREVALSAAYVEVALPDNAFGLPEGRKLCHRAEMGISALYGAVDHPTSLAPLSDLARSPRDPERDDCQAPKRKALGVLQDLVASRHAFPTTVPFGLVRVGDTWVSFAPAELTFTAGYRVRRAVAEEVTSSSAPATFVRLGGLTNGYVEYVATPEEYGLQRYEGGSTLYGPMTAPFFAEVARSLARYSTGQAAQFPHGTQPDVASAFAYDVGPERRRLARDVPSPPPRGLEVCRLPNAAQGAPMQLCFRFEAGEPNLSTLPPFQHMAVVPELAPESGSPCGAQYLSDSGYDFVTGVHGASGDGWLWTTLFVPTQEEWSELRSCRERFVFELGTSASPVHLRSASFSFSEPSELPAPCSVQAALTCGAVE